MIVVIIYSILIMLAYFFLSGGIGAGVTALFSLFPSLSESMVLQYSTIVTFLILIGIGMLVLKFIPVPDVLYGADRDKGISRRDGIATLTVIGIVLLIMALNVFNGISQLKEQGRTVQIFQQVGLGIGGISEEIWYRGIIFRIVMRNDRFKSKPLFKGALIISLLFGLSHIVNAGSYLTAVETAGQVIYAVMFSLLFSYMTAWKRGSLLFVMILHFFINLSGIGFSFNVVQPSISIAAQLAREVLRLLIICPPLIFATVKIGRLIPPRHQYQ